MRYGKSMSEALAEIREGFSKKEIKMAIGIASDPRYKQGNYSGAVRQIEKIKKGLASHPQVAAVLKRQNEEILEKVKCPDCEGEGCPKCEGNGYIADAVDKEDEPFLKDLIKNLRKGSATHSKQADDLEKAVKEETELDEGGHTDVASAKNQVKVAMSALQKMETELGKLGDEDSLPTWWTNKVAIAVDKLDGMADYLDTQVEEVELDEMKEPFVVVDTADGNKVVGTASSEKGAKEIITTAQLPPMKIKDKKTLKIVKVKKKQMIGYPIKEGTWHIPDSPKLKSGLKKLMSKPIKLGKDGDDAVNVIGKFIGDDELYDDLYVAGKKNPNGDARDVIKKAMKRLGIKEEVELDEAKEVLSRFKDDKLKKSIMNLATQKGLKVKEMGDKLEVSGNARKVMDLTLAVQKHDVKVEHNMMSAYTAAITKGVK